MTEQCDWTHDPKEPCGKCGEVAKAVLTLRRVVKMEASWGSSWMIFDEANVPSAMECLTMELEPYLTEGAGSPGDTITLTLTTMTEEEYKATSGNEFEGFDS